MKNFYVLKDNHTKKQRSDDNLSESGRCSSSTEDIVKHFFVAATNQKDSLDDIGNMCYTSLRLYQSFKPIWVSLKIIGLHYEPRSRKSAVCCSAVQVYCFSIAVLLWTALVFNSVFTYKNGMPKGVALFFSITSLLWNLLGAVNATCIIRSSCNPNALNKYFFSFSNLEKHGRVYLPKEWLEKSVAICCSLGWTFSALGSAYQLYISVGTPLFDGAIMEIQPVLPVHPILLKLVIAIIQSYFFSMWIFVSVLQISLTISIYYEFMLFHRLFSSRLKQDGQNIFSIENERRRFLEMRRIVDGADETFSFRMAACFGCNVIGICLLLYSLMYYPEAIHYPMLTLAYVYWLTISIIDLVVSCSCGILIRASVSILSISMHLSIHILHILTLLSECI